MGPIAVRLHLVHLVPVAGRLNSPGVGTENVEGIVIFLVRDSGQCIDRCDVRRVDDRLALDSVGSVQRDLTEQTVEVAADEDEILHGGGLEHFPTKWMPVRGQKMRQNRTLEHFTDPVGSENALDRRVRVLDQAAADLSLLWALTLQAMRGASR